MPTPTPATPQTVFDLVSARRKVEAALRALQAAESTVAVASPLPEHLIRWKVGLEVARETTSRVLHEMFTHREPEAAAAPRRRRRAEAEGEADDPLPATGLPSRPPRDARDPETGEQVTDAQGNPLRPARVAPASIVPPPPPVPPMPRRVGDYTPPPPTPDRLAAARAEAGAPRRVRERANSGPCRVLGVLVSETATGFSYRREPDGRVVSVRRDARRSVSGTRNPAPHVEPCESCEDHPNSNFGPGRCRVHGNPIPCTTCMET